MYFRLTAFGIPHGDPRNVHLPSFHRCSLIDVSSPKSDLPGVIGAKPDVFSESPPATCLPVVSLQPRAGGLALGAFVSDAGRIRIER
jgi:hypothetical protein